MVADRMIREQGSRDWRMLPVAGAMWAASLLAHLAFAWRMEHAANVGGASGGSGTDTGNPMAMVFGRMTGTPMAGAFAGLIPIAVLLAVIAVAFRSKRWWAGAAVICLAASCVGGITAIASDTVAWHDPAAVAARRSSTYGQTTITVASPPVASDQRGYGCQMDVRLHSLGLAGEQRPSAATVRVYAAKSHCTALHRGAEYRVSGLLQQARYGRLPLWLLVEDTWPVTRVRPPPAHTALIHRMQEAFFTVTGRLSDQGRVLVPGLTMGILGQDHVEADAGITPINGTYARTLEDRFRRSGIMHLMAVSGGHFIVVAGLIRRLCMRLLMDRRAAAVMIAIAYLALASAMFPSDSVTRALIMGLLGSVAYAMGRRVQALSALCWTVMGVLAVDPGMSQSYGFALSASAVLGIVLFSGRISDVLSRLLPDMIADMLAMTMAAQSLTLPIQVLMEPELPLLSIPANLLVSPFVNMATIAGLMALACAWYMPWLAGVFARIASAGTLVMERVALWLGGSDMAAMPWADGIWGAVLILMAEIGLTMLLVHGGRHVQRLRRRGTDPVADRFGSSWRIRLSLWVQESLRLFSGDPH